MCKNLRKKHRFENWDCLPIPFDWQKDVWDKDEKVEWINLSEIQKNTDCKPEHIDYAGTEWVEC